MPWQKTPLLTQQTPLAIGNRRLPLPTQKSQLKLIMAFPKVPIAFLKVPISFLKVPISFRKVPIAFLKVSITYLKVSFLHAVAFPPGDCWSRISTCSAVDDCQLLNNPMVVCSRNIHNRLSPSQEIDMAQLARMCTTHCVAEFRFDFGLSFRRGSVICLSSQLMLFLPLKFVNV